ncbi:MAG: hypothetical protein WD990_10845 [Acidimicrobiia bacterium]
MYKHRFDSISFVFGLGFVALALLFTLPADPWDIYFGGVLPLGWVWPLVIIGAGAALLAPIVRPGREALPESGSDLESGTDFDTDHHADTVD